MGLMGAMNASLSGLRVTQAQMEVVSNNISNSSTVGYSRRQLDIRQRVTGENTSGALATGIQRQLDVLVQKQLRVETAGAAFTDVRARYARQLDQLFGAPGQAGSLDTSVNTFTSSLQTLTANPSDFTARAQVMSTAQQLASTLNGLSSDIQRMREDAEANIASGIDRLNNAISRVADADRRLTVNGQVSASSAALLDDRDSAIQELAALVDVRVVNQDNGKVSIFTNSGLQIYSGDGASSFTFDQRSVITANSLFTTNPADRGVGTIRFNPSGGGAGVDVIASGLFRSGEIAAEVAMRDKTLVEAQTQIDDLAAALASSLGDRNPTTPVTVGANAGYDIDLADVLVPATLAMKAGNTLMIDINTPTGPRRFQVIATDGPAPNPIPASEGEGGATIIRYDRAGGFAGLQAALAGALPAGFSATLTGSTLRVVNTSAGNAVTGARASFSTSGLTGEGPELQMFVDLGGGNIPYTGSLDTLNPQRRGLAGRIGVNANLVADTSRLVVYNTTPGSVTPQGDSTRPRLLLDRLTNAQRSFSAGSGIGDASNGFRSTVTQFARRVVEDQGANAAQAMNVDEGQKLVLRSVEARFSETSGVSIDQEMSDLVQIQNAYAANARVVGAVKELFDMLLRIGA